MEDNYYISNSKYVQETISYFGDFSDTLIPGETITGTPVITVITFSGIDSDPAYLLYEGPSIIKGKTVEQRLRLGIVGCIYSVVFSVSTSLGNTYEQETKVAIVPVAGDALPTFTVQYETSAIYPYVWTDSLRNSITIQSGRLAVGAYYYNEGITNLVSITSGTMVFYGTVSYAYNEGITNTVDILSGNMVNYPIIPYAYSEGIFSAIAITAGSMVNYPIFAYTYGEGITNGITITSGTLT